MPKLSLRFLIPIAALVVFVAGPSLIRFYTEWLWFGEVGYQRVYSTILGAQATLFVVAFAAAFVWLAVNLHLAMASMRDVPPVFTTRDGIEVSLPGRQQLRNSCARRRNGDLRSSIGLYAAARWEVWMAWRHAVPFRPGRPSHRLRRRLLRLLAAVPPVRTRDRTGTRRARGAGERRRVSDDRQSHVGVPRLAVDDARPLDAISRCWPPLS